MSIAQTLSTSLSGLTATQASLSVIAGNIANSQTPGYVTESTTQVATQVGGVSGAGVQVVSVNRTLDQFVQQQFWTESAGGGYADLNANFYQQLQNVYGQPGSSTALDAVFNNFTSAVQALTTSPSSSSAQSQTVAAAQSLAQQLNSATGSIQSLRTQADAGLNTDVQQANNALQQIANINQQLAGGTSNDSAAAALQDQRDQYISQVSQLLDVRVVRGGNNQVTLFTNSGQQLVGAQAGVLKFDPTGKVTATQQLNADPTKSGLSSIMLVSPSGSSTDLVAEGAIRSGEIAGYLNVRDNVLVQAQAQVDQIASQMSSALSDTTTSGVAATSGAQSGFDLDISGMSAGNTIQLTYTDALNVQHDVSIVRVDDPSVLPLSNSATANPNDTVVGVDFSGGPGAVAAALNAALGATGLQFGNPAGSTLEVLDSGPGTITVNNASTTKTATSLTSGSPAFPLFTDGGSLFTNAVTSVGGESVGYAGRISVNAALTADPSKLVTYQLAPPTAVGDTTRPNYIYNQLVNSSLTYLPTAGVGSATAPFHGTLSSYISQMVSTQSIAAQAASNLKAGQDVVVNALQSRFNTGASVNIDTEMANLLALQNTYQANARVMSTAKAMLDTLMQAL